ncbi:MAG: hypothetical protein JWN48_2331 [Myxococcaceae bacterium]|nr:hypothetical protein [Myxococcaceae bacterium]
MPPSLRTPLLLGGAILFAASTTYAVANLDATDAGWQPLVTLFGGGDKPAAVKELHRITNAFDLALHHFQIDEATQEFTDGTIEDLEDFALADFYDRLPNKNGDYRELWVRGEIKGKNYVVSQAKEKKGYAVTMKGDRNDLAAMSTTVRSKETKGFGDTSAYFIGYRFGLGIGNFRWDTAMSALQEWARLNMTGNPTLGEEPIAASAGSKSKAKSLHPKLSGEDLEPIGVLFDSYPALAVALSRLGSIDDVRTTWPKKSYQQVSLAMHADVDRFGEHYPAFAKYGDKLGDLALIDIKWLDSKGRTLMTFKIDSDKLSFAWQCYVKDGRVLPFKGVKVYENEPVDPMTDTLTGTQFVSDARLKLLGVVVKLTGLKTDVFYQPHEGYMESGLTFTELPKKIEVEGAALGFVPTAMVDAFIPGNIESVTRDFLNVAAHGNGGKGFIGALKLGVGKEGATKGVLETGVDFDALDNFLVKIGLGMVSDKLIPDADAFKDIKKFSTDLYDGFVKDLARFEKHGATASND